VDPVCGPVRPHGLKQPVDHHRVLGRDEQRRPLQQGGAERHAKRVADDKRSNARHAIDGRLGIEADRGEFLEDAMKAIVGRGRVAARLAVATPDNRNRSWLCLYSGKGRIIRLSK
jgi:hypothetical protein